MKDLIRSLPGYDPYAQAGGCRFDEDQAQEAIDFIEQVCSHVRGELSGKPLVLEGWQRALVANLFGWYRPDGTRRYREAFVFVPRKNGKTCLAAALINHALFVDREPGIVELYSTAGSREQAKLCFRTVAGMIRGSVNMRRRAVIQEHVIRVGEREYKALASEAGVIHGTNPQFCVNDELHAQRTPDVTEAIQTGMGSRRQPLLVHVTTSDWEREGSICNAKHEYASKVRDGILDDPAFLPAVYEAGKDDDWTDPEVWRKANPNLGVSVSEEYLTRECQRAIEDVAYTNTFQRYHLNIRTQALERWIDASRWEACRAAVTLEDFEGEECWCGLDTASKEDFNAFVMAFRHEEKIAVFPVFWVPEDTARRRERERRIPYGSWAAGGFLRLTPGDYMTAEILHHDIVALLERFVVAECAVDRWGIGTDVITRLTADGVNVFAHGQGSAGMIPPTSETKRRILSGDIEHDGNPVLSWMVSNVVVYGSEEKEYPEKKRSADKIDGVIAMIMAVGRAAIAEGAGVGIQIA